MKNTLDKIQKIFSIAAIVVKVLYILCIIGAIGSMVGFAALLAINIWGVENLEFLVKLDAGFVMQTGLYGCVAGAISSAAHAVLLRYVLKYLENEMKAGTPFDLNGAKEIFSLGILTAAIPLGVSIANGIIHGIWSNFATLPEASGADPSGQVCTGLLMMAASLVFRYGAELIQKEKTQA